MLKRSLSLLACATALAAAPSTGREAGRPAGRSTEEAERRAERWAAQVESRMTDDERFALLHGFMPLPVGRYASPESRAGWPGDVVMGAGYVRGVPRLGVPSLRETDASLGVTNPLGARPGDTATALPAAIALGATFDPGLAYRAGRLVGVEARAKRFNVLLGGGVNLQRDPRGGRNFEYLSEDPWLSGVMGGAAIRGAQDAGVVSTAKHLSLNSNETQRQSWNAVIEEGAHRESDLLAFQIAIERGRPGAVMCAYNLVNGADACGGDHLLNKVLKRDWGYRGWVMSDWGAVRSWRFALHGLDQQSGEQLDKEVWFDEPLRRAVADGSVPRARLSDMVRRILRSIKAAGLDAAGPAPPVDAAAHAGVALAVARAGVVLLSNDGALPLPAATASVAVIGHQAHVGVLSGAGSSQVTPPGGWAADIPVGGPGGAGNWRAERWFAGAPLRALRDALPGARVEFDPGVYPQDAAAVAARAQVAVVFVSKHESEGFDSPDLSLPRGQDAVVEAVAAANPNTVVVLQAGNPVAMPWAGKVRAVVAAWYPGQEGARAIAEVLTGAVNPSGRTPITWPASLAQLPRPTIPGYSQPSGTRVDVPIVEGADVGYRWFAKRGLRPLHAFGHGLSYTKFAYGDLRVEGGRTVTARFTVRNTGWRAGADVPQLYLQSRDGRATPRLLGFRRVELAPGGTAVVTLAADPRLLARYDVAAGRWRIDGGRYAVALARAADAPVEVREVRLAGRLLGR